MHNDDISLSRTQAKQFTLYINLYTELCSSAKYMREFLNDIKEAIITYSKCSHMSSLFIMIRNRFLTPEESINNLQVNIFTLIINKKNRWSGYSWTMLILNPHTAIESLTWELNQPK